MAEMWMASWTESEERYFWGRIDRPNIGCWQWTGGRFNNGYGAFWQNGSTKRAHRAAWIFANGVIPEGMLVCHHCDNRGCCRPSHLFLGTALDNQRDCIAKGRKRNKAPSHCIRGHDDWAFSHKPRKRRYCRTCDNARYILGFGKGAKKTTREEGLRLREHR